MDTGDLLTQFYRHALAGCLQNLLGGQPLSVFGQLNALLLRSDSFK